MSGAARRRPSPVAVANEKVPITLVCRLVGVDVPDDLVRTPKVHCPFGDLYHADGGLEAALRIYPESNSVFCFAGCGFFGPVGLAAHAWDTTRRTAAVELLARAGLGAPDPATVWAAAGQVEVPDVTMLAEALKIFCRRVDPDWARRQFDPEVAALLTRCLALLDHVGTVAQADRWLRACKPVMAGVLSKHLTCVDSRGA